MRWPPNRVGSWSYAVEAAAREWSAWVEDHEQALPALLLEAWVLEGISMPLEHLAEGLD